MSAVGVDELEEVVARAAGLEVSGYALPVGLRTGDGGGYAWASALYRAGPQLEERIRASAAGGDSDLLHLGAQWWFERCAWAVAAAAQACALTSGVVPSLAPEDVLVASADGVPTGVAFAAGLPPAHAGRSGLGAAVREQLEAHLAPLADAIAELQLRARTPLWRSAGDRVVQAALWVGTATARQAEALALAEEVLEPPTVLHVPIRVRDGLQQRRSCCLAHRTPSGAICADCPRAHGLDR